MSNQADFDLPYDEVAFLGRLEDDRELGDEIAGLFLETCPKSLKDLQDALEQGDLYTLGRLAHGVKGSVGVFAAEGCFEAALGLEMACRNNDLGGAQEAWVHLKMEIQRLAGALGERVGGTASCDF